MKLSLLFVFLALCILLADGARNKENRRKKAAQHSRQPRQQQPGQAPRAQRVQPVTLLIPSNLPFTGHFTPH